MTAGAISAAVDSLRDASLPSLCEDDLLALVREVETARRQLEAFETRLIAAIDERNLPGKYVMRSTAAFLGGLLNLSAFEAGVRVRHARELGPRQALTGEQLPPLLPLAAESRAAGRMSSRQAEVIIKTVQRLRTSSVVTSAEVGEAEAFLVEQADTVDAEVLARIAQRLLDTLDPDGVLADAERQSRLRRASLVPAANGMHRLTADLDAETAAIAAAVLHALSAPKPDSGNGERDQRSHGQRMHDALRDVFSLALRSGRLPRSGGVPATVLITMTAEQFETGTGIATTSFGQKLTVPQAMRLADEASVAWIVHNSNGGVSNHGRTVRLATEGQTIALIARDQGCSFPGCMDPPEWTEKHHVIPWRSGGCTDIGNLVLLCTFHHAHIDTGGWTIIMRDGVPWYIPPTWIDPEQAPRRNERP